MSSVVKDRGRAGWRNTTSKPSKTLIGNSQKDKPTSQRIPLAPVGKETSRSISAGRPSVARPNHVPSVASGKEIPRPISAGRPSAVSAGKENPRSLSAGRASVSRSDNPSLKPIAKPSASAVALSAAIRCSTSSLPRGKFTDFRSDRPSRVSTSGERRSFSGFRALDKDQISKGQLGRNSSGKAEKSVNLVNGVLNDRRFSGCLGGKPVVSACKVLDAKQKKVCHESPELEARLFDSGSRHKKYVSGPNVKLVDCMANNGVMVLQNDYDVISTDSKQLDENRNKHGTLGSALDKADHAPSSVTIEVKPFANSEKKATLDLVSKRMVEAGVFCVDNTSDDVVKECLNLHPDGNDNSLSYRIDARDGGGDTSLSNGCHRGEAVRLAPETVKADGNMGVEVTSIKYQSKLHEKLALLEGKVQKIALEIKQTKDMLDKNKQDESRLALSDIQKKICGVERAVGNIKDGTKCELVSPGAVKFGSLQNRRVPSSLTEQTGDNSLTSIKNLNNDELDARFFSHHKLMRDPLLSFSLEEQDKICEPTLSRLIGDRKVDDDIIDENSIALEFLDSLNKEQPKHKNFDLLVELNHGVVSKMELQSTSSVQCSSRSLIGGKQEEVALESNEKLDEFDNLENTPPIMSCPSTEESSFNQLSEIGRKISTGGWFVSEGEAVLLAHDDNTCSYYDIANSEVKSEYKPPAGLSSNLWADCWLIRAPGVDGCSGRYVVAASAGNALESGFCCWDFYTKDIKAFEVVGEKQNSFAGSSCRTTVAPMTRSSLHRSSLVENQSCWYRPCGSLLVSASCKHKLVNAYDIRDGDLIMTWDLSSPVIEMEYSSPLQWRSRVKMIIAEREAITLWDVNSLNPQPLLSVPCVGKRIHSLHVNNTDAEIGAGVRQRASAAEVEGNDGVFCTQDSVNVFDFRIPSGVGHKFSRHGANALSIFSRGDSILIGSTEGRLPVRGGPRSHVEHFSLRKGRLVSTYVMPEFNSHYHHSSITQVWGNSSIAMGICGMGLFVFDAFKDEGLQSSCMHKGNTEVVKETIGPNDLYRPTFDYLESRVLVISRDRPAFWRYL